MKTFSKVEEILQKKFKSGHEFLYKNYNYKILMSGKPSPSKGECKTDLYILCIDSLNRKIEFKISIKLKNYEFVANKINLTTAQSIFGTNATKIIYKSTIAIKELFLKRKLFWWDNSDENLKVTLGWKFEIFNKTSRELKTNPVISSSEKVRVLKGSNDTSDKINSKISGQVIENSGIPDYLLFVEEDLKILQDKNISEILNELKLITDEVDKFDLNFGFTAINYRHSKFIENVNNPWDGNRPLAVHIEWIILNSKLSPTIKFDDPLSVKANTVGSNLIKNMKLVVDSKLTKENYLNFFHFQD